MVRLLSSSVLLAILSFAISIIFLFIEKDSSSFAFFALIQINQAYSASLNNSLFYTPLFSNKQYRTIRFLLSQITLSICFNILYSFFVALFLYISTSMLYESILSGLLVFFSGLRIHIRSRISLHFPINNVSFSDFIFFTFTCIPVILIFMFGFFSISNVVICLLIGCFSSILYMSCILYGIILRLRKITEHRSYFVVLKASGFTYILISILSEFSSNFFAYFLSFKSGHHSVAVPSLSLMCFRPFNLSMTVFEEKLKFDLSRNVINLKSKSLIFVLISVFFLISNYSVVMIISEPPFTSLFPFITDFFHGEFFYFFNCFLFILFLRVIKQLLLVNMQVFQLHTQILICYAISFCFLFFCSVLFFELLSNKSVVILMIISESLICVGLFTLSFNKFRSLIRFSKA